MKNADLFLHEDEYGDLDAAHAVHSLSRAIQFRTTSYVDTSRIKYEEFDKFHDFLREAFPAVMRNGKVELVGESLLITLEGSQGEKTSSEAGDTLKTDHSAENAEMEAGTGAKGSLQSSLRPALFMAHQDVVPIVDGTWDDWKHDPFSGDVADGYIWGRGAMDIKEMLIGILESAEYLLTHFGRPKRTIYLAFGQDEETLSTGARAMSNLLKSRGVELEYVLDEGAGDVYDAADYGAPGELVCPIGIYEKGYVDMELTTHSRGGHSSNPFYGTSLGAIAKSITQIVENPPAPSLSEAILRTLHILQPYITEEPMKTWAANPKAHEKELLAWFLSHESLYHQVQTTVAPTQITGGSSAGNVMPQTMKAVINFRLTPDVTPQALQEYCQQLVGPSTQLRLVQQIGASRPSEIASYGYEHLQNVLEHYFDRLHFIPMQNRGATDCRQYEQVCRCCLRFGPFLEEEDISAEGIHGTNERISVRAYLQGIRVLLRLMQETCY